MTMHETTAYIALGSNLGDRLALVRESLQRLDALPGVRVVRASSAWETEPVGVVEQPRFINAAAQLATTLEPEALLGCALEVERALGRERCAERRFGPRRIDIDLLLHGAHVVDSAVLTLPHPRMLERAFVLAPLVEIAPHAVHPVAGRCLVELTAHASWHEVRRLEGREHALWPQPPRSRDAHGEARGS